MSLRLKLMNRNNTSFKELRTLKRNQTSSEPEELNKWDKECIGKHWEKSRHERKKLLSSDRDI